MDCHSYKSNINHFLKSHSGNGFNSNKKVDCIICYSPKTSLVGNSKLYLLINNKTSLIASTSINYIYYPKTVLYTISPLFGKSSGGTVIEVYGKFFKNYTGWLQCSFGSSFVKAHYISEKKIICM